MKCLECGNRDEWVQVVRGATGWLARRFNRKGFSITTKADWTEPSKLNVKKPSHAIFCGKCGHQLPNEDAEDWLAHESLSDAPLLFTEPENVAIDKVVKQFKRTYKGQIITIRESDSEKIAQRVEINSLALVSATVRREIAGRLKGAGIYRHQKDAIDALVAGQNVMLATATSSGKSLCFQSAIMEDAVRAHEARSAMPTSLYLGPLNALIDDQFRSLSQYGVPQNTPKVSSDFFH